MNYERCRWSGQDSDIKQATKDADGAEKPGKGIIDKPQKTQTEDANGIYNLGTSIADKSQKI